MSTKATLFAALALSAFSTEVMAQPTMIRTFDDWGLYSYKADGSTACYVLTLPQQLAPSNVNHGDNFFLVAPKPSGAGYYPQAIMGYELRDGSQMRLTIGDQTFTLVPKGKAGWTQRESSDADLIAAMKAGRVMTLEAVSQRGTETRYVFSLKGVSAALGQAERCN